MKVLKKNLGVVLFMGRNNCPYSKKIKNFLSDYGDILKIITIGDYIYGSRVIHPLLVGERNVKHDSKINEVFANNFLIDNYDRRPEFSYSSIYVVRKN